MKKVYEAPEMSVEIVHADEMLLTTSFVMDKDVTVDEEDFILSKDRDNNDFGGLW